MEDLAYLKPSDAFLTSHHSFVQDKKEEKGTALLGLTLRGMQVYQVRACVLPIRRVCISADAHESESAITQGSGLCIFNAIKPLTRRVRNVWAHHQQRCSRR